jgi:serine/threonine-protein kinase
MSNPRAIARFQREARVGAQLQHENLVRIYDFGESNGRFFLVMEYIEGKTIGALISAQGPMPAPTAARLVRQIALGLEHAHRKGLIHRDVNPYNVLVTHDGIAKLADLGLAIDLAEDERVTREGATVGTFDYVAPEQARHSHSADIRSDIYSLGCTLYHMISGRVPFPGPSLPEKLFAHQALEPRPLQELVAEVPTELVAVIRRMMRKQPEERYPTPWQVAQALEPIIDDRTTIPNSEPAQASVTLEESRSMAGSELGELPKLEPEELSPAVLEPDAEFLRNTSSQPTRSVAPTARMPASNSPVLTPMPVERQPDGNPQPKVSPINLDEISSTESIPLILDLGPEPPLSESLRQSKFRPETAKAAKVAPALPIPSGLEMSPVLTTLMHRLGRFSADARTWVMGLVATILLLVCMLAVYSISHNSRQIDKSLSSRDVHTGSEGGKKQARTGHSREALPTADDESGQPGSLITVRGNDGVEVPAADFLQAAEKAMGARGWVEFHNRQPLVIPTSNVTITSASNTWLKLRPAAGVHPVLIVEVKGPRPFLTIGSGISLIIEGLEVIAHYVDQSPGQEQFPPPIIKIAGPAHLERCLFKLKNSGRVDRSRAIVAEGGDLSVRRCCFQGLDTAVEVHAIGGSISEFQETMAIPASNASPITDSLPPTSAMAGFFGWGIKLQFFPGGRPSPRQLILEHCTMVGQGLVQIEGFSSDSPVHVNVRGCAIQTKSVVGWLPVSPSSTWNSQALVWQGEDNLLDVADQSWLTMLGETSQGTQSGTLGRDEWLKLYERNATAAPIQFLPRSQASSESYGPTDFAIKASQGKKAGANPSVVGPGES